MRSRVVSSNKQSNTSYHRTGGMNWWARIGAGENARFLTIPKTRGDQLLDCEVDLEPGTHITIGVGRGVATRRIIREDVVTQNLKG